MSDEPTCIYNPAYRPGDDLGWKIVMESETAGYFAQGWVRSPRESIEARERITAEIEAEKTPKRRGRPRKVKNGDDNPNG